MKLLLRPVLLCALLNSAAAARPITLERTWEELNATIRDQWIDLVLPDHTRVRGRALRITPEALAMDVRRSSNHALHPRGRVEIPRASVSKLDVLIRRSPDVSEHRGGLWGAAAGAILSQGPGLALDQDGHDKAAVAVGIAMIVIGGYLGHRFFDHDSNDSPRQTVVVVN